MPKLHGLIFDLDGTLLDSAPDLRQALNATLRAHNRRDLTLEEVKGMTGDGMLPMIKRAFAATGSGASTDDAYSLFQEFIGYYRTLKPSLEQIYPHVLETLEFYRGAGVKLGLCTNKQEASTFKLLEDLNLIKHFDFIAGGDTFPVHKPHPDHVRGVIEKLGVAAENCAMIGDSPNDVMAAQGAGIPCVVVTHGYYAMDYAEMGANALIPGFKDLKSALEKLGF